MEKPAGRPVFLTRGGICRGKFFDREAGTISNAEVSKQAYAEHDRPTTSCLPKIAVNGDFQKKCVLTIPYPPPSLADGQGSTPRRRSFSRKREDDVTPTVPQDSRRRYLPFSTSKRGQAICASARDMFASRTRANIISSGGS